RHSQQECACSRPARYYLGEEEPHKGRGNVLGVRRLDAALGPLFYRNVKRRARLAVGLDGAWNWPARAGAGSVKQPKAASSRRTPKGSPLSSIPPVSSLLAGVISYPCRPSAASRSRGPP